MKILIDLDTLERDGVLTPELAATLRAHATRDTGSTAINLLLAFGAIAIAAGMLALVPSSAFAAFFGAGFILLGWLVEKQYAAQWGKLGGIWMIVGALILSTAIGALLDHPFIAPLVAAGILGGVSVLAKSRLLIALTPLALAAAIGGSTGYWHACYAITVREPTLTILLFSGLAYGAWQYAKPRTGLHHHLAVIFARMCVILVNFGFWIGSLWGDTPGKLWHDPATIDMFSRYGTQQIPAIVFILGWAVALLLAGAWAAKHGRRFMVNTVAVFAAIHFYTQWFEHIGMHPVSVIIAGVATIGFGLALWRYNRRQLAAPLPPAGQ